MTTIAVDTRTFRLRLPVLWLGRVRGSLVVRVTEQVELHVERRHADHRASSAARVAAARAESRLADLRTAALAQRLPGF